MRWVSPEEAVALNPTLAPGGFVGATYCADRGLHRPAAQRARLRPRAPAAGVELRERCDCEELLVEDGRVVGVRAGGETSPARG